MWDASSGTQESSSSTTTTTATDYSALQPPSPESERGLRFIELRRLSFPGLCPHRRGTHAHEFLFPRHALHLLRCLLRRRSTVYLQSSMWSTVLSLHHRLQNLQNLLLRPLLHEIGLWSPLLGFLLHEHRRCDMLCGQSDGSRDHRLLCLWSLLFSLFLLPMPPPPPGHDRHIYFHLLWWVSSWWHVSSMCPTDHRSDQDSGLCLSTATTSTTSTTSTATFIHHRFRINGGSHRRGPSSNQLDPSRAAAGEWSF